MLALALFLAPLIPTDLAAWPAFGGDAGGSRFSPLSQINTRNVARLKVAWTYHTGDHPGDAPIECTPLEVDGTLYLTTASAKVVAVDAIRGTQKWIYDTKNDLSRSGHARASRGVAFWSDGRPRGLRRILFGTPDGRLLSLDAVSGIPDPAFRSINLRAEIGKPWENSYVGISAAPTIYGDLVYVGIASSEDAGAAPGDIMAFSVRTGKRVWTFHVIPRVGEFGHDVWSGESSEKGGAAGAWNGYVVDDKRGILYAATGSATPDFDGSARPGNNLFANCVIALDARTGKRLWHFQTVHHDLWDHDNASAPILCKVRRGGVDVDAVAEFTKTGFCFVLDRLSGKPLFEVNEVAAPPSVIPLERAAASQPEPVLPPALSDTLFTLDDVTDLTRAKHDQVLQKLKSLSFGRKYLPPTPQGTVTAPGYFGGSPWSGASFDPRTNTLFVNSNNVPSIVANPARYEFLTDDEGYPGVKPPWGTLTAINLNTGHFRWRKALGEYQALTRRGFLPTGTFNLGGTLTTAGNLVFVGATCDATFRAFDSRTGAMVFKYPLPASAFAAPCTYRVNGTQYVLIAASGGGYAKRFGFDTGPVSDSYVCFRL